MRIAHRYLPHPDSLADENRNKLQRVINLAVRQLDQDRGHLSGPSITQEMVEDVKADDAAIVWVSEVYGLSDIQGVTRLIHERDESRRVVEALETRSQFGDEDEDMAAVGRSLMEILQSNRDHSFLKHWRPAQCPSEIVTDLLNELDERAKPK